MMRALRHSVNWELTARVDDVAGLTVSSSVLPWQPYKGGVVTLGYHENRNYGIEADG